MLPMDAKAFGRKLKELRLTAGLTQKQLAGKAGLTQGAISCYEQGQYDATWPAVLGLCRALGVTCEAFMDEPLRPKWSKGKRRKTK